MTDEEAYDAAFVVWWNNEGSGMPPLPGEEAETHVHRVSRIAWMNGAFKARERMPITPQKCIRCGRVLQRDDIQAHGRCDDCEHEGRAEEWEAAAK